MSASALVVGAGPVGRNVARLLGVRGERVTVATRSGTDLGLPGVRCVALDARDADALTDAARGAAVLYNCANPGSYERWAAEWPPLAAALLAAAERSGAVYAITGNLYPYGPVDGPMTPDLPDAAADAKGRLRARIWADARAAHEAGRVRAFEVRGSDYVGAGVGGNGHVSRQLPRLRAGRRLRVIGSPDEPHTFTDVLDVARTLIAAAGDDDAHGRIWHVPSNPPRTQREALGDVAAAGGLPTPRVSGTPIWLLRAVGLLSPLVRELVPMTYQWTRPYVLDDAETRGRLRVEPTPWDEVCRRTLEDQASAKASGGAM
ncbi:MAG TPA: NAD-dependent epimerase/dehydratase family protein [Solirubrobacteraceae bacterium]|nr:NAD-dependent epimerase/dehydratase family protein [Solirubrobacteraceae bacterium]